MYFCSCSQSARCRDAALLEQQAHLRAHVLEAVHRRHREVAALDAGPVRHVAALELLVRAPGRLLRGDADVAAVHADVPVHLVEDEELGLGPEVGGVADAAGLQVGLGALGERARVAIVGLAVPGLEHVAAQDQRRFLEERVDVGRVGIGHQQHVRRLDALPAGDRRSVEGVARGELVLLEGGHGDGDVLFLAAGVGEAEVDELDFVLLHHLHHVGDGLAHSLFSSRRRRGSSRGSGFGRPSRSLPAEPTITVAESVPLLGGAGSRRAWGHLGGRTNCKHHDYHFWCTAGSIIAPFRCPAWRRGLAGPRARRRRQWSGRSPP